MNNYKGKGISENRTMADNKSLKSNAIISAILKVSSSISILLMILGLVLFLMTHKTNQSMLSYHNMGLRNALAGAMNLNPLAFMNLGILVLLVTPFLRVIGAFFSFLLVEKERKYAMVSMGVLIIITISLFVPGLKG